MHSLKHFKQLLSLLPGLMPAQSLASAWQRFIPPTAAAPPPSAAAAPGVRFTEATRGAGLAGFQFVSGTAAKDYII